MRRRRRENNKNEEEEEEEEEEGNVVKKKDSLLSLTILIDFFQIAVYLTLCFKRYLVSDFIASNY